MPKRNQKNKLGARIGNVVIVKPINRARTLGSGRHRSHNEQQQVQMCLRPYMRTLSYARVRSRSEESSISRFFPRLITNFLQGADGIPNIYKSQSQRKQSAWKGRKQERYQPRHSGEEEVQKEYREPVRCRWHNRAAGVSEEMSQLKLAAQIRTGSSATATYFQHS